MKIAIMSDLHLGYAWGTEREKDSFRNAEEALSGAVKDGADIILIAGDIFDDRVPKQEVWGEAMSLFSQLVKGEKRVDLVSFIGKEKKIPAFSLEGVPIIAIHGTHERRSRFYTNPIEALESGGYLVHLHNSGVLIEKEGVKIAIQGMSGVPEEYAKRVLKECNFRTVPDAYNILMLHQSVKGYVYSDNDEKVLQIEDFPPGFDVYVLGHIHKKQDLDSKILIPGSTIVTQMKKDEIEAEKGYYILDISSGSISSDFRPIKGAREMGYLEIEVSGSAEEAKKKVLDEIRKRVAGFSREKPFLKVKIKGNLDSQLSISEEDLPESAIISMSDATSSEEFRRRIEVLRKIQSEKLSMLDLGVKILSEMMPEYKRVPDVFELLVSGENEKAVEAVLELSDEQQPVKPEPDLGRGTYREI